MNMDQAIQTVSEKGFTQRQAQFLVFVARHSGVCLMRQYSRFAGIVFGQKTRKFFAKLERLEWVSTYDCAHNRARIYHVRHRDLYEAIGEPESRLRRPPPVPRALERLMVLDAMLEHPNIAWLSTAEEKVAHVTALTQIAVEELPHAVRIGETDQLRYFPDRVPIGIHSDGRWELVILVSDAVGRDFRALLQRHAAMLSALPAWTIRIAVPAHLAQYAQGFQQNAWSQLATPLKAPAIDELRWYFEQLRKARSEPRSVQDERRFQNAVCTFSGPRYPVLYRAWQADDERTLKVAASHTISAALRSGAGKIEPLILPHAYSHLAPMVGVA